MHRCPTIATQSPNIRWKPSVPEWVQQRLAFSFVPIIHPHIHDGQQAGHVYTRCHGTQLRCFVPNFIFGVVPFLSIEFTMRRIEVRC